MDDAVARKALVQCALAREGQGPDDEMFVRMLGEVPKWRIHWCAIAIADLWMEFLSLERARWRCGKGILQFPGVRPLTSGRLPRPGDCAYFHKCQHHALVLWRDGAYVRLLDPNAGAPPGVWGSPRTCRINRVAQFFSPEYRDEKLVDDHVPDGRVLEPERESLPAA